MKLFEIEDKEEIFDEYLDTRKFYSFEGEKGVSSLEQVVTDIGYRGDNFRFGDPISSFLCDNPGCIEAIMEWIKDNLSSEQTELLKNFIEREKE